ncbi:MAG: NUDIX domain-containing protein [bacterium]
MNTIRIRVAGILVKDGQLLLVRHEKNNQSYWLLPGGGVEYGESLEQALTREFEEEVGLHIEVGSLVLAHDSIPEDRNRQGLNLYFLVTTHDTQLQVTPDEVLRDAAFHSLEQFKEMKVYPDAKIEILRGIETSWNGGLAYLGNLWKDR